MGPDWTADSCTGLTLLSLRLQGEGGRKRKKRAVGSGRNRAAGAEALQVGHCAACRAARARCHHRALKCWMDSARACRPTHK